MGRAKRLRKLKNASRKAKGLKAFRLHRAMTMMQKFKDVYPEIGKVCVLAGESTRHSGLALAIAKGMTQQNITTVACNTEDWASVEASVYKECLERLAKDKFQMPTELKLKMYDELDFDTSVHDRVLNLTKKPKKFNDKKYF